MVKQLILRTRQKKANQEANQGIIRQHSATSKIKCIKKNDNK